MLGLVPEREVRNATVGSLKMKRLSFEPHWADVAEFLLPYRHRLNLTQINRGDRRNFSIIDPSASLSVRAFKAGAMGYFISPSQPWFMLEDATDPDLAEFGPAKEWLELVRDEMLLNVYARSNLYNATFTFFGDWAGFGTGATFIDEHQERIIHARTFECGSYWIDNDAWGRTSTFYREFRMTIEQIVKEFLLQPDGRTIDWSKASIQIKQEWNLCHYHTEVDVAQLIELNHDYNPMKLSAAYKRFKSAYFELSDMAPERDGEPVALSRKGYDEFPVLASRWEATENCPYGIDSPGMTAVGDIKQLQHNEIVGGKALDKMVDPPMMAPAELKSQRISMLPGKITWFTGGREKPPGLGPLHEVKFDIDRLEAKQAQVRNRISECFHEPLFKMLARLPDKPRTATEISARREEQYAELAPAGIRHNFDYADPLIERTFNVMMRRRLLPPPPRELWGRPLKVRYTSLAAQAAKAIGLEGIDRTLNVSTAIAAVYPEISDKIDYDQLMDEYAHRVGIPSRIIRADDVVAERRAQRQQQLAAQQAAETMSQTAKTAKDLSEANTEKKSALTDVMGELEGQAA